MATLSLRGLFKQFGSFQAVKPTDFDIASGEFVAVLGPSGCGKTTLLRLIAGFEIPTGGTIVLEGKDITALPAGDRRIGMVFQNYALFPHMNVFDNVAFGLRARGGFDDTVIRDQVLAALESVRLASKARSPVPLLSGGEQQRVAVARALVLRPQLLLFDEPLSNLDVALRLQTREEIRSLQKATSITTIYVTHDQAEAMSLADRIAVMRLGMLEGAGSPQELYDRPANPFIAEFLGGASLLEAESDGRGQIRIGTSFALKLPPGIDTPPAGPCILAIKPEAFTISEHADAEALPAIVASREYTGFTTVVRFFIDGLPIKATFLSSEQSAALTVGAHVPVRVDWRRCSIFPHPR